jgi:hypothetical protein
VQFSFRRFAADNSFFIVLFGVSAHKPLHLDDMDFSRGRRSHLAFGYPSLLPPLSLPKNVRPFVSPHGEAPQTAFSGIVVDSALEKPALRMLPHQFGSSVLHRGNCLDASHGSRYEAFRAYMPGGFVGCLQPGNENQVVYWTRGFAGSIAPAS